MQNSNPQNRNVLGIFLRLHRGDNYFQAFQGLRRLTKRYNRLTTINNWKYLKKNSSGKTLTNKNSKYIIIRNLYNKGIEEKSKLFALLQRPQDGGNEESYKMVEYGL